MHSFTEENYLKIIYHLSAGIDGEVSTNALSEQTQTKAASVSDMLRKLADKNLIHYKKYQGVRLTEAGQRIALAVIRKHRLWEVFLVQKLGFGWDEVHHIAEQLEHIDSEELIAKLDEFLDFPKTDPHGDPIPDQLGEMPLHQAQCRLSEIKVGQKVVMMGVAEDTPAFLQYLDKTGLKLGCGLLIEEENAFDKSLRVSINGQSAQFLSHEVAKCLLVK
ncbi:MAG: metal-dependent transcriptional regulator [Spirosomataceae bacterium]